MSEGLLKLWWESSSKTLEYKCKWLIETVRDSVSTGSVWEPGSGSCKGTMNFQGGFDLHRDRVKLCRESSVLEISTFTVSFLSPSSSWKGGKEWETKKEAATKMERE